jgi:uncharacterized protein YqjF (DUF2071 family)
MTTAASPELYVPQAFAWPVRRPLLSAEWRNLALLNYEIDSAVLQPFLPAGTELDFREGKTYVSIVGFQFVNTRLFGLRIPGHADFEEVNLRFYVRRCAEEGWRRGVVFIRELAPRRAVALTARWLYNENYLCVPMRHFVVRARESSGPLPLEGSDGEGVEAGAHFQFPLPNRPRHGAGLGANAPQRIEYQWKFRRQWRRVAIETDGAAERPEPGSHEEFIIEHYWGYSAGKRGQAKEYLVAHRPWRISPAVRAELQCDVAALYGPQLAPFLQAEPASAFWADGSPVRVYPGKTIT